MAIFSIQIIEEFGSVGEALQHLDASGRGRVIRCGGRCFLVGDAEVERIEAAGVPFALMSDYQMPDGPLRRISTPVNN